MNIVHPARDRAGAMSGTFDMLIGTIEVLWLDVCGRGFYESLRGAMGI
jgi:hypothetical protein